MDIRSRARGLAALALAGALLLMMSGTAFAHAERSAGPFDYEIGFGTEPAYVGQPNSVQLILNKNGKPVTDMTDQLKVAVSFGSDSTDLAFEPNFEVGGDGEPGDYRAWFVPSQPGKYTFHLTGTLDGTKFDETVTSGPDTFDAVQDLASARLPAGERPDQRGARLADRPGVTARRGERHGDGERARARRRPPRTIALIGVVLGALGADRRHRRARHQEARVGARPRGGCGRDALGRPALRGALDRLGGVVPAQGQGIPPPADPRRLRAHRRGCRAGDQRRRDPRG